MSDYNLFQPKLATEIMVARVVTLDRRTPALDSISHLVHSGCKGAPVVGPANITESLLSAVASTY